MDFAGKKGDASSGKLKALVLAVCSVPLVGYAADLKPGPIAGNTVYLHKARGYAFCEFEVIEGKPPNLVMQIYNTSKQETCTPVKFGPINAEALAKKVGAVAVVKNPPRFWLMDRLWVYDSGETRDFDGVKATWMGSVELKGVKLGEHSKPFPAYTQLAPSRHSKYEWLKGSEVYLLRDPNGKAWIMQAYTNLVDKTLTIADLPKLGSKLKLPPGWKYEVKTLDRDFTYIPLAPGYVAHAVADDLQNVYQGCGFDTACNYNP